MTVEAKIPEPKSDINMEDDSFGSICITGFEASAVFVKNENTDEGPRTKRSPTVIIKNDHLSPKKRYKRSHLKKDHFMEIQGTQETHETEDQPGENMRGSEATEEEHATDDKPDENTKENNVTSHDPVDPRILFESGTDEDENEESDGKLSESGGYGEPSKSMYRASPFDSLTQDQDEKPNPSKSNTQDSSEAMDQDASDDKSVQIEEVKTSSSCQAVKGEIISITHEESFRTEEEVYNFAVNYGDVIDITDDHGGNIDETVKLPRNLWIQFSPMERRNFIFDLNLTYLRIVLKNESQRWLQQGNTFKNISHEQDYWKRGRNVISEDELLNEIPQNSDVVIWLKIRVEKGTYYNIRTDSTYKGKKMPCAGCRGKLCLYEVSKAQAVTRLGRLDSFKNYYPHKCIFMSSVSSVEINP